MAFNLEKKFLHTIIQNVFQSTNPMFKKRQMAPVLLRTACNEIGNKFAYSILTDKKKYVLFLNIIFGKSEVEGVSLENPFLTCHLYCGHS